jgi:hypothetical protein
VVFIRSIEAQTCEFGRHNDGLDDDFQWDMSVVFLGACSEKRAYRSRLWVLRRHQFGARSKEGIFVNIKEGTK